jgi:DNA-binding transcriptional LysR family regulator
VSTTIAQYVLPRLIGAFLSEHPRVQLSLQSGNTAEIVPLLLEDKVAIGLIAGPARDREVRTEPFMEDEMVLIAPADFEFGRLTREQLLSPSLLMRGQGSGSRRVVQTALEKAGCRLKSFPRVMNLDSTEAIKSAVEAGLGIHFSLVLRTGPEPQGAAGAFREFALARARILSGAPKRPERTRSSPRKVQLIAN